MYQKNLMYIFFIFIFSFSVFLIFNGFFFLKNYNLSIPKLEKSQNNTIKSIDINPKIKLEKKINKGNEIKELLPIKNIIIVKKK